MVANRRPTPADVTVVVTGYDHQAYIEQCLDSIAAQTVRLRQVIVIDDASRDQTADVMRRWLEVNAPAWTFVPHTQNRGVCATLNEALDIAEGEFFAHVSGDDWEEPDRFARQVAALSAVESDVAVLIGDIREVDGGGATIVDHNFSERLRGVVGKGKRTTAIQQLLEANVIPAPAVIARTEAIRDAGGYDESLAFEDYDMWTRLVRRHTFEYLPGIVANYRVLATSMWRNADRRVAMITSEADVLSKHIGLSGETDNVITTRLLRIAGELLDLEAPRELRHVLTAAGTSSKQLWLRAAAAECRSRRSLVGVRRHYHSQLGVSSEAPRPRA